MSDKRFDFDDESGDLSLDYANTKNWHASEHPVEELNGYDDVIAWGEAAGLLSSQEAEQLQWLGLERPDQARAEYEKAIELREVIYRIFSCRYAGRPVSPADLALFNSMAQEAMTHLKVVPVNGGFQWEWMKDAADIGLILWPVAHAAAKLMTSEQVSRVRECEDDRGCGYLFIDHSKNRSRRWCSMESCGNRAKARRHYARQQDTRADR